MRQMVQIFPAKLRKLWNNLELRILVLLSLFLQIVLIATGNRRKYTRNRGVAIICWLSYLSADAIATLALGVLSQSQGDEESLLDPRYTIMAFWAPFLLMHLGGPDTITAYSLADNELWSRHLLGLIGQVGVAVYVFLRSWISTPINYLSIAIFVAGLVKYGERSYALYLASRDQFRNSMVSVPDPGPNYAKFMDELVSKENEGYKVDVGKAVESDSLTIAHNPPLLDDAHTGRVTQDAVILQEAYQFFGTFKKLFADLILSFQDKENSLSVFSGLSWNKAFEIIEVELGLVYDLFYTKALVLYSPLGGFFRILSCSTTIAAIVAFMIIDKDASWKTEVIITYFLLVGAIFLEIYAIMILLSSDMVMIWLSKDTTSPGLRKLKDSIFTCIRKIVALLRYLHIVPAKMRWSNAMGQDNLLKSCVESKPTCTKVYFYLEKYLFWNSVSIPDGLKALIFDELKVRASSDDKGHGSYRGDKILLKEMKCFDKSDDIEFDQSVLLWHIATDICYHAESCLEDELTFKREMSRYLSNYMIYLLIMSPFMLPSGIGQIRFQDTCAEAREVFEGRKFSDRDACEMLSKVDTRIPPSTLKGDRSKSLLFDACRLVQSLKSLEDRKWEKITQVWLDLLTFAAAQCRWNDHAEKLSQGGELLTHVWLLMAHFGMTDDFQISQGYMRAKLVAV
ncbi:hypothetical protein CDL12_08074 [Handroanthus impetiginosus]|uniref:DUF4220 domain-containing protein n=1 Tax=Handroanthus impetiginosus TaxID=429701 RepID=A0A2G9HP71_9LAMI|nr:hypothetical protein CDL12_08074 [Handroanthus impetiginosus]